MQIFIFSHGKWYEEKTSILLSLIANASPPLFFVVWTPNNFFISFRSCSTLLQRDLIKFRLWIILVNAWNFRLSVAKISIDLLNNSTSHSFYTTCLHGFILTFLCWMSGSIPYFPSFSGLDDEVWICNVLLLMKVI